ncbi:hypothetical protein FRC00_007307 [Tulasnella sp. 408]|nr:hypothetical protein FRC00_007307 [Tulasnella sp. 408]
MPTTEAEPPTPNSLSVNRETRAPLDLLHHFHPSPIHSLPPEVLHLVFLPFVGEYSRLLHLRLVCKYWAEVIDSTAELWKVISNKFHPGLQAMIIRNSGNHLLDVEYDQTWWKSDPEEEDKMAAFAWLIESAASRWQALIYRQADDSRSDTWPLSLPLHNLERIKINGLARSDQHPTLDAPKLSSVHVSRYSLDWRSLSGLRALNLESTDSTLDELTVILHASPDLQDLSLQQTLLEDGTEGFLNSSLKKIRLPRLCSLDISGARALSTLFLLSRIEAPGLRMFWVDVDDLTDAADCTQICEAAGRYIGALPLLNNQDVQAQIRFNRSEMLFGCGSRTIMIQNPPWTGANGAQAKLACIAAAMKHLDSRTCEEITDLYVSCPDDASGECLRLVHSRFPRIVQIVGQPDLGTTDTFLQHLSSPSQLGSAEEWLFPKLAKLQLYFSGFTDTDMGSRLAELVKRRKEAEGTGEITEVSIIISFGVINGSALEILKQSLAGVQIQFDIEVVV